MAAPANEFFWYELATTDPAAAERFYRAVVGWETSDAGQPDLQYTILSAGARGVGGIMALSAEACAAGATPGWMGYVRVDAADAAVRRIVAAGGSELRAAADIPEVGRFAVVVDPGGAAFMVLAPLPHPDAPAPVPPQTPRHIGWHELYAGNGQEAAFAFYREQFGWETIELLDMGEMGQYRIFGIAGVPCGGMMDRPPDTPRAAWAFYVNVEGIDAAIERITANGGQVLMGPHEVPGGSWIVQALDPQGANFALVAPTR